MNPLFPGTNHRIPLQQAKEMTERYKTHKKDILKKEYEDKHIMRECETFNREAFDAILAQSGCVGLRIYFAMDQALTIRSVIVGVNADNQDILPLETGTGAADLTTGDGVIIEDGRICPPDCPTPPSLTS